MISKLSDVSPNAKIGNNVEIGAFTTIQDDVVIGDGCWIGPNVVIMNGVRIGSNCRIFPGAVLGAVPQDLKFKDEDSILEIGNNVTIREYCTLNRGTEANYATKIGDHVLLMAYVHVAHDCVIGEHAILANNATLAGHITIGKCSVIGGMSAIHQFVKIGEYVMLGGGSLARKDVPPYVKAAREPLAYAGVNSIGLRRRGFTNETINHIQDIYRTLFVKGYNIRQATKMIDMEMPDTPQKNTILKFISESDRGIMKGFRQNA